MATQLQWRNIDVPNTGNAVAGISAANRDLRDSFGTLGQLFIDNTNRRRDDATNRALAEAAMVTDLDGINALRQGINPDNRMVDNMRLAEALNQRGQQLRADRLADTEFSVLDDRIRGAGERAAGLQGLRERGDSFTGTGGAADYLYLDALGNAYGDYRNQQNNDRDFTYRGEQDAIQNRFRERQLAEQAAARREAAAARNAEGTMLQRAMALTDQYAKTGGLSPADIRTQVARDLGGLARTAGGLEAINSAVEFRLGALGSATAADRMTRGEVSDADAALRNADGYQRRVREQAANQYTGDGLEALSDRLKGKTVSEFMKEANIDAKQYPVAEVTDQINRIQSSNPGISRADAMALAAESLKPSFASRLPIIGRAFGTASVDSGLVRTGAAALRNTRQAGTPEERQRTIEAGDREVGKMAARLQSLAQREQLATATGADGEVIGQLRQARQDLAGELDALVRAGQVRMDPPAEESRQRSRRTPQQAPVSAQPLIYRYGLPGQ